MNDGKGELSEEMAKAMSNVIWERQIAQIHDIEKKFSKLFPGEAMVANISSENGGKITYIIASKPTFAAGFTGVSKVYKLYKIESGNHPVFTGRKSTDPLVLEGLAFKRKMDRGETSDSDLMKAYKEDKK